MPKHSYIFSIQKSSKMVGRLKNLACFSHFWHTTNLLLRRLSDVMLSLYSWQSVFNLSVPVFLRFPRKLYCSHVWSGIDYTFPLLLFPGCFSKLFMDGSNNRLAVCRFIYFSVGYVVQIIVVYNPDNYLALVVKILSSASKLFSVGSFVGLYFKCS